MKSNKQYQKHPTMRNVAKIAKVSVATVSRAINMPEMLKSETLQKVRKAIRTLAYSPNSIARSLKINKSCLVGIIIPDILNPFFAKIVRSAQTILNDYNFTAIICDTEENSKKEDKFLCNLFEKRVDGLIVIPSKEDSKMPNLILEKGIPTVFVDRYFSNAFDSIKGNNYSGIALLVSHLTTRGYKKIGIINGPMETLPGRERYDAFLKALSIHKLDKINDYIKTSDWTIEDGYRLMKEIISLKSLPDGIVITSNLLSVGALRAIKEKGLKIPDDIGIAVFDEVYLADLANPPLTVVVQPAEEMGKEAARILIERISGNTSMPKREIVFEPRLIIRESTR